MNKIYKNINIDELKTIVNQSDSFVDVTKLLGFDYKNINIKRNIERLVKKNNISTNHFSTVKRLKNAKINYTKDNLSKLVSKHNTFKEILEELELLPFYTNYNTLKKYLKKFNIDYSHITKNNKHNKGKAQWDKENLKKIVSNSKTHKEILEKLGIRAAGGNYSTLKNYLEKYKIDTAHLVKNYHKIKKMSIGKTIPLNEILIENSNYNRTLLKKRLYKENIKKPICELCGQDENWMGKRMSLILDHINGVYNDNRIENLRIVCPNCNATLDTHCSKNNKKERCQSG